jgi:tRNA A-37 threonylcarbamoyl transferase component Bud32
MRKQGSGGLLAAVAALAVAWGPLASAAQEAAPIPSVEDQMLGRAAPVADPAPEAAAPAAKPVAPAPKPVAPAAAPTAEAAAPDAAETAPADAPAAEAETADAAAEISTAEESAEPTEPDAGAETAAPAAGEETAGREEPAPGMTLEEAAGLLEPAPAPAAPDAHAAAPVRPQSRLLAAAQSLEDASRRFEAFVLGAVEDLQARRMTERAQILAGAVSALVVMLLGLVWRIARGRGEIQVQLSYPLEMKGTFSVRLSTRRSGARPSRIKTPEDAAKLGASSRHEHHMVARETSFRGLLPGTWHVSAEGFVQGAGSGEVISTHFEELEARVARRQVTRLDFDFQPRACALEVRVCWDRRPVEGALVARRGAPGSMRMARAAVTFSLDRGPHVIVAGNADRVAEVPIEIESFQPRQLLVDLAARESLLFTGCPPAVAPYLHGDVPAAARALERDGQTELANRLLAGFHLEHDRKEAAARHYESAGMRREAAELWQSLCQFERAATLFEQSGEDERAAENYRSAGKLLRAGDAYARADAYDSAVECFRRAGDVPRWIEALEKKGAYFQAARVALDQGERARGLQCLYKVPVNPEAVARMVEAHAYENSLELGMHKVDELIGTGRDLELSTSRVDALARLLEEGGAAERALALLERLRERDATWPGVATRVEALRKRRSRDSAVEPASGAPSVFSSEFRYEILEEVGRGGMGIVFKARDRRLGRVVALKRLPDNLRNHPKAVELFLREARAAAALNHPNIVTLFDAGQEGDTYYITMELLQGNPLQKILRARKRLAPEHVAKLGGQVATGLQYAHDQGIVHRDIKTANLFFTEGKLVKIMDFGLAKMVEEVRRATTVIGGTPYYMAPEQSAGDAVDHRADLYALGVTFYELLTGSVPFREGDVAFHHRHTPPPDPRERVPELPESMVALVLHLMAKRPEERVASAAEVRARLQEIARSL